MYIVTGAAGFIGSILVNTLSQQSNQVVVAVDDFSRLEKRSNIDVDTPIEYVERDIFFEWLDTHHESVEGIYHIGARTDTALFDKSIFDRLNVLYSQKIWEACCRYRIPMIYASSAATYGRGEHGYGDDHALIPQLKPLNPYGESKQSFDCWALERQECPPFWAGFKFFNVYGPNEYHKGRMASVVFHTFNQIKQKGSMTLFRSHRPEVVDGNQSRDFVYVKDVVDVLIYMMQQQPQSGIYNLGTGQARTFLDLASATFMALGLEPKIDFMDTPEDIRKEYQYYTQAEMGKLRAVGYTKAFHSLEEGVVDYVQNYLNKRN